MKEKGLEDQLLAFLVRIEQPKLEEDKSALVITVANNKHKLVELENQILTLLKTASGSLLDDEGLINTLQVETIISRSYYHTHDCCYCDRHRNTPAKL